MNILKSRGFHDSAVKPAPRPPRKKALLLAVSSIRQSNDDDSSVYTLTGPQKDVSRVKALITEKYNYLEENICTLVDGSDDSRLLPTRENIIREMHALVHDARAGDRLLFVYAGHGAQVDQDPFETKREPDGKNEGILPSDGNFDDARTWILDDELNAILVKPLPRQCRLMAIFDSCHSGTALDLLHYECNRIFVPWFLRRRTSAYTVLVPSHKNTTKFTTTQTTASIATASSSTGPSTTASPTHTSQTTSSTQINTKNDSTFVVFCNDDTNGSMRKLTREIKQNHVCRKVVTQSEALEMKNSKDGNSKSKKSDRRGVDLTSETTIMSATTVSSIRSQRSIAGSLKNFFSPSRSQSRQNSASTTRSGSPSIQGPQGPELGRTRKVSVTSTLRSFASISTIGSGRNTETKRELEKEICMCCDFALKNHRRRAYRRIPNELKMMISQLRERSIAQKVVPEEVEITKKGTTGRNRSTSFVAAPTVGLAASIPGVVTQVTPAALNREISPLSISTTPGSSRVPTCTCNCHFRPTKRRDAPSPPPLSASPEPSPPRDVLPEKSILINPTINSASSTTANSNANPHTGSTVQTQNPARQRLRVSPGSILIPSSPYHSPNDEISADFRRSWGAAIGLTSFLGEDGSPIPRTMSPERISPQECGTEGPKRRNSGFFGFHPTYQRKRLQSYSRSPSYPSIGSALDNNSNTPTESPAGRIMTAQNDQPFQRKHTTVKLPEVTEGTGRTSRKDHQDDKCEGSHEPGASDHLPEVYSLSACCDCQVAYENRQGDSFIHVLITILEEDPRPTWHTLMHKLKYAFFKEGLDMHQHYRKRKAHQEKKRLKKEERRRKRREEREAAGLSGSSSPAVSSGPSSALSSSTTSGSLLPPTTLTISTLASTSSSVPVSLSSSPTTYHDPHLPVTSATAQPITHSRTLSIPAPAAMHSRSHSSGGISTEASTSDGYETTPLPTPDATKSESRFLHTFPLLADNKFGTNVGSTSPRIVDPEAPVLNIITENITVGTTTYDIESPEEDVVDPDERDQDDVQEMVLSELAIQDPVLGSMAPIDLKNRQFSL